MPDEGFRETLTRAIVIVWLVVGLFSGLLVAAPLVASSNSLQDVFPVCAAKAAGGQCALCGMTTAFIHIGEGDWNSALRANGGSLALYSALTLNFGLAFAYTMWRVIRHANS